MKILYCNDAKVSPQTGGCALSGIATHMGRYLRWRYPNAEIDVQVTGKATHLLALDLNWVGRRDWANYDEVWTPTMPCARKGTKLWPWSKWHLGQRASLPKSTRLVCQFDDTEIAFPRPLALIEHLLDADEIDLCKRADEREYDAIACVSHDFSTLWNRLRHNFPHTDVKSPTQVEWIWAPYCVAAYANFDFSSVEVAPHTLEWDCVYAGISGKDRKPRLGDFFNNEHIRTMTQGFCLKGVANHVNGGPIVRYPDYINLIKHSGATLIVNGEHMKSIITMRYLEGLLCGSPCYIDNRLRTDLLVSVFFDPFVEDTNELADMCLLGDREWRVKLQVELAEALVSKVMRNCK